MTFEGKSGREISSEDSLRRERALTIAQNQVSALPMNCVLALTVFLIVYGRVPLAESLSWLYLVLVVNTVRYIIVRIRSSSERLNDPKTFLQIACVGAGVSGALWGIIPIAFMNVSSSSSICLLVILCGISAGSFVQGAAYLPVSLLFSAPPLCAAAVHLTRSGRWDDGILAADVAMFLIFLVRSAWASHKGFADTTIMRHKATTLAEDLFTLANHDTLTKLANRAAFGTALDTSLAAARAAGGSFYLLLLDLDNFKFINDTLGHSAGDGVLVEVARRLLGAVDASHQVARIGGDEFVVLLDGSCSEARAHQIADSVIVGVTGPFASRHPVTIEVSAGLAKFPDDGNCSEDLLGRADLALYAAKNAGRRQWRRFDAALLEEAQMVRDLEQDLPEALSDGSVEVWFQPQIALDGLRISGVEALIRWRHPRYGWLAPPLIVKTAQRLRQSEALTGLVLDHACRLLNVLTAAGFDDASVAVNVSPSELDLYSLPDLVRRSIELHGVAPGRLEIEITEEAFIGGDGALKTLLELSDIGVRLAIDDFGTGCSSIAYLRTLQVDRIKVDRTFVSGFADRSGDRILVQAILGLGRSFGIEVIAEGVETLEEAALLAEYGCPLAQGYHFGRPMSQAKLLAWLTGTPVFGHIPHFNDKRAATPPPETVAA